VTEPLKPHQIVGRDFLASRTRALLADEPGVQKTRQAIEALDKCGATSVLIICPAIGRTHWAREIERWGSPYVRTIPRRILSYAEAANPETWKRAMFYEPLWDVLILDEVHYAKNPIAKRTRGVFAKGGAAWHANRIWALSGTPAPNNPAELWVMLRAFGVCRYEYQDYVNRFCNVDRNGIVRGTKRANLPELRRMLLPLTLRRTMMDVMPELGEISLSEIAVPMDRRWVGTMTCDDMAMSTWNTRSLDSMIGDARSDAELFQILSTQRIEFATARRYMALLKAPSVYDILKFELENGLLDKVTVFGYHVDALKAMWMQARKDGIAAELITGATPEAERYKAIDRFNSKKGSRVVFANIIAAGQVINLSAAHQGIMLELDWVPDNNAQAIRRMRRPPQTKPISIRVAVAAGSPTDEIVARVVERKTLDMMQLWSKE